MALTTTFDLTPAELRRMLSVRLSMPSFLDMLNAALAEPRHNIVYYRGATGETRFLTPDDFLWAPCGGPSDCVWIVPGEVPRR